MSTIGSVNSGFCKLLVQSTWESIQLDVCLLGFCPSWESGHMTFCKRRIVSTIGSINFGFCSRFVLFAWEYVHKGLFLFDIMSTWHSVHLGVFLLGFCPLGSQATCHSAYVEQCLLIVPSNLDSAYICFRPLGSLAT